MKSFFLLFCLFPLFLSCGLFDLRDPEEPSFSRSSFVEPFSAADVPDNLSFAFADGNLENFRKCLVNITSSENYVFYPSPELQNEIPVLDSDDEQNAFTNLKSDLLPKERITVQWSGVNLTNQIDSAEWKADYKLLIPRTSTDYPSFIEGKIILTIKKAPNGLWFISRWRDYSLNGEYCWSDLKWRFLN